MPTSRRRQIIAARCRITGEPKDVVASLVGRDASHGLDDCTEEQLHFRALLALFLLNAVPADPWPTDQVAARRVWQAWSMLERFLPYPETLVVTTPSPDALAQALTGARGNPLRGMPGLRHDRSSPPAAPVLVHVPTGATLCLYGPGTPERARDLPRRGGVSGGAGFAVITPHERRVLSHLPHMDVDAERLLAALLIRLPLTDPDGIWALANRHLEPIPSGDSPPTVDGSGGCSDAYSDVSETGSQFLWGRGRSWHFGWNGPVTAFDIAAALTDTRVGLADTTVVLPPWRPVIVRHGTARLTLHGDL